MLSFKDNVSGFGSINYLNRFNYMITGLSSDFNKI